jgi:hypothetical protein
MQIKRKLLGIGTNKRIKEFQNSSKRLEKEILDGFITVYLIKWGKMSILINNHLTILIL